jgi:hypothetical protein
MAEASSKIAAPTGAGFAVTSARPSATIVRP